MPSAIVGRAVSFYRMSSFGGMAVGSLVWGQLAALAHISAALATAGAFLLAPVLLGLRRPLPRL